MPKTDQRSRKGFRASTREVQLRAVWGSVKYARQCKIGWCPPEEYPGIASYYEPLRLFLQKEIQDDRQANVILGNAGVPVAPKAVLK